MGDPEHDWNKNGIEKAKVIELSTKILENHGLNVTATQYDSVSAFWQALKMLSQWLL